MKQLPKINDENNKRRRIDQYWFEIPLMKEVVTQIPRFPNLSNLAKFLLLILHRNSFCEGVFSTVKKVCTDSRQNLGKYIVGRHAHSSVYESETGIRNNLVGLLIAKINIFKQQQLACYQWKPSKELLKISKFITYRNVTAAASKK